MSIEKLAVDLPYPPLAELEPDTESLGIVYDAYSSEKSELNTTLQYVYHRLISSELGMEEISRVYARIFVCEMEHLDLLGTAICKLGGDPRYILPPPRRRMYYSASAVNYSTEPRTMLLDDIAGENEAIAGYNAMLVKLGGKPVASLIRRIIMDEELHRDTLKEFYAGLCAK